MCVLFNIMYWWSDEVAWQAIVLLQISAFYFSNLRKGRLHYIRAVGRLVGRSFSFLTIRTEKN